MSDNVHLRNAAMVREKIDHLLPGDGPIDFTKLNIHVQFLINCSKDISSGVPLSMSSLIAQYTMANFASQFQYKFQLGNSKIPTNLVGFLLAGSGASKDSTVSAQAKAMDPGYLVIEQHRRDAAQQTARDRAEAEGGDDSANWGKYFREPLPLENSISTVEGLTHRLNTFAKDGIGMPAVYVGELGSELQSNPNMSDNIRLISELFDEGNKKSKAIKDNERQDAEVKSMGMNALFVGSEDNIILDKAVSTKFKTEFITKLARRSIFVYPSKEEFEECIISYADYDDMTAKQETFEDLAAEGKAFIGSAANDIASTLLESEKRILDIDEVALQAFKDYKMYTNSLGNGIDFIHKPVQLEQLHRSWKMLKLAGVYAIWDLEDTIGIKHIEEAIYYIEKIGGYLEDYEVYAEKENYELLCDYFQLHPGHTLTLHELKKRGFINGNTGLDNRVKELIKLADSLAGSDGIIKYEGDVMSYKPFEKVGDHWASYVKVSGTKQERATQCHSGFQAKETTFAKLATLLANDTAYTPFKFADGRRKNDNIISGATWVALDVDNSDVTIDEMHDMLDGTNHHISTTSDATNPYKFRIILEFNNIVDLPVREWKVMGDLLGKELGITIDPATFTKSQIMFGYKGAKVLSEIHEEPYDITSVVKTVDSKMSESFNKKVQPTITQKRDMLDNPLQTFAYAFKDDVAARSLTLFRVWNHVFDLGGSSTDARNLMSDLNYNFWSNPISDERFEIYVKQMERKYEKNERN